MIPALRSAPSEPGVTFIRAITGEQVQSINASASADPAIRACLDSLEPKFRGELGACIFWMLVRVIGLSRSASIEVITAINRREKMGSTGVGRGLAVPHTRHQLLEAHIVILVLFPDCEFEYEALDAEPVHSVFLAVTGLESPSSRLRVREDRAPISIYKDVQNPRDSQEVFDLLVERFRLREPLTEEWLPLGF